MKLLVCLAMVFSLTASPKIIPVTTPAPQEGKVYPIAIIGAGAAGTMAVQRAVLNNTEVLLFSGAKRERKNSCGNWVKKVDNIPSLLKYKRAILEMRNEVLEELVKGPLGPNLFIIEDSVCEIRNQGSYFELVDGCGRTFSAQFVVLATGIMKEQPVIQGSIKPILGYANSQSMGYCMLCDGHRAVGKKTVVIGHSKEAAETASHLKNKYNLPHVPILTNGKAPTFDYEDGMEVYDAPIQEIIGDAEQTQLYGFKLSSGEIVEANVGFVAMGIRPNNRLAVQLGAELNEYGLVVTDENCESSIQNLFVIGDLRANSLKQIYTAWQHAADALLEIDCRARQLPNSSAR